MTLPLNVLLIHRSRVQVGGLLVILQEVDRSPLPAGCTGCPRVGGVAEGRGADGRGRGGGGDEK